MSVNYSSRLGGTIGISFRFFFNMKVCCVFSLELPCQGDSYENKQNTIMNIKRYSPEIIPNTIVSAAVGFFLLRTQERV